MTVIPAYMPQIATLRTTFKERGDVTLISIEKRERLTSWVQLFLIFPLLAGVFESTGVVLGDVYSDLHKATLEEAHEKGLL